MVVFPYVDQKHLKSLEIFCVGYSVIDLDCTVLDDVVSIMGHEVGAYSQNPNFYFIYNASKDIVASLCDMENVHCIVNTHEDVSQLGSEDALVFYNKKSRRFLNWKFGAHELSFENYLFEQSQGNASLLHDSLIQIKSFATRIYTVLVETNNIPSIPILFNEQANTFPSEYWERILGFMEQYHDIRTPPEIYKGLQELKVHGNGGSITTSQKEESVLQDFSSEYDLIASTDRAISNAFVRALHDYRSDHVNSANLELSQLYNPKELYTYLRNHHWKDGIDEKFVKQWFQDSSLLSSQNENNVKDILSDLRIPYELISKHKKNVKDDSISSIDSARESKNENTKHEIHYPEMPSIKNFNRFKKWIFEKLSEIESQNSLAD